MEVFPGKVVGSYIYVYENHTYNKDKRSGNIFRCNKRRSTGCRGAIMDVGDGSIKILHDHDHVAEEQLIEQQKIKLEMLVLCRETLLPLKQIFDDICRKYPDGGAHCSFRQLRPTLQRERSRCRPKIPESFSLLCDMVKNYEPLEGLLLDVAVSGKGEKAIIISTETLLVALSECKELYVDGTFAVLPKKPHIGQLYTIHMRYLDNGIATILVLCEKRTVTLYDAVWKKIIHMIPILQENIKFIMSDYEKAAVTSLRKLFPNADIHGCWFHYCQAVLRKWRKLGLNNASQSILHMTMSLPLAPALQFEQGLSLIQKKADAEASKCPNILLFMTYMRCTWSTIASRVSVYNCSVRTNNIAESFHNIACLKLGKQNINVWAFLEKVKILLFDQQLDLIRLKNGIKSRRRRTIANINHRKEILHAQQEYDSGRLSLEEFLNMFTHKEKIFQINKVSTLAEENSNDEVEDTNYFDIACAPVEDSNDEFEDANYFDVACALVANEREHKEDRRMLPNTTLTLSGSLKTIGTKVTENDLNKPQKCISHSSMENIQISQNLDQIKVDSSNIEDDEYICEILEDSFWYGETENKASNNNNNNGKEDREHKEGYCTICFVKKATQVCVPCGHLSCCRICIMQLKCNRCPTCNVNFNTHVTFRIP